MQSVITVYCRLLSVDLRTEPSAQPYTVDSKITVFRVPKHTYSILLMSSNKSPSFLQQNRRVCFRHEINLYHN